MGDGNPDTPDRTRVVWDGSIGSPRFPAYTLRVSELTDDLEVATEYPLDRTGAARSKRRLIGVDVDAPFDARLSVFRWEAVQAWEASYEPGISTSPSSLPTVEGVNVIDLQPGANLLGFYVEVPSGPDWTWAGFDWATITYEPQPSPTATGTAGPSDSPESPAPTASPTPSPVASGSPPPAAAFTDADCTCPGVFAAPYATRNESEGPFLRCDWRYKTADGTNNAHFDALVDFSAAYDAQAHFDRLVGDYTSALSLENINEGQVSFLREPNVLTRIDRPEPAIGSGGHYKHAFNWYGLRVKKHGGTLVQVRVHFAGAGGADEDAILESLDAMQACGEQALDRVGAP